MLIQVKVVWIVKRWYPTTTLHGVTAHKTSTWIFTDRKNSNLATINYWVT